VRRHFSDRFKSSENTIDDLLMFLSVLLFKQFRTASPLSGLGEITRVAVISPNKTTTRGNKKWQQPISCE
jgi:hypothetical protein